jgi:hypothetical protein
MADSKRKQAEGKRSALWRRGRHGDAGGSGAGKTGEGNGADGKPSGSLLETTTQASEEVKQLLEAAGDASRKIREAARTGGRGGEAPVEGDEPAALISKINQEVRTVLEAADEAAEKIRDEAHADARRLVEENRRRAEHVTGEHMQRVSDMADTVLSQLAGVQSQIETLRRAVDQSVRTMGAELGAESPQGSEVWSTKRNGADEEDEADVLKSRMTRSTQKKAAAEPEGISEGARLLALQQHMAGVDGSVIEKRLSQEFGIEDPGPILEWMGIQTPKAEPTRKLGRKRGRKR